MQTFIINVAKLVFRISICFKLVPVVRLSFLNCAMTGHAACTSLADLQSWELPCLGGFEVHLVS